MTTAPHTRDWINPFTAQTHRDVPLRLAERLDAIAGGAPTQLLGQRDAEQRENVRSQIGYLLSAFSWRVAYRRALDELHAGDDGLLPISSDRRAELQSRATTYAGLRDLDVVWATQDGADVDDAALAAGITCQDALDAIARERERGTP